MRSTSHGPRFSDRIHAGRALADELGAYAGLDGVIVLGLPRGGIPVAAEVAAKLDAPLDVWLVRKLGVPGHEELAMGAIACGGVLELDRDLIRDLGIGPDDLERTVRRERAELERRERAYRRGQPGLDPRGRTVILVDDGMATGASMRAAIHALQALRPARIVAAVPVASKQACADLRPLVDECVCVAEPEPFRAVGLWYDDFDPTSDAEVVDCLDRFSERNRRSRAGALRPSDGAAPGGGTGR